MQHSLSTPFRRAAVLVIAALSLAACGSGADEAATTSSSDGDAPLNITIDEAADDSVGGDEALSGEPEPVDDGESSTDGESTDTEAENAAEVAPQLVGAQLAPEGERSVWSGTIDGRIGLTMWLTQQDDLVRGELTYDSVGEPITVHGRAYPSGDAWLLREFGADGQVTGTLILESVADGVVGSATWGELDLDLTLDAIDTTPTFFDPLVRPGHYQYAFAPFPTDDTCCGSTGSLRITEVGTDELTIEFDNATGAPAYNLAIIDPTVVSLDGNVARYELTGDGVDCVFDVEVFDGFAHVRHVDDRFDCLFGNAAGVEGIYVLTEQFVSAEDSPFAGDAVLTSDSFGGVTLGLTWAELVDQFGAPAYDPATADQISEGCNYVRITGDPWSPWFMLLGDGEQAIVSRIELGRNDQFTASGIGLGSTSADVRAAHAEVITEPHVYIDGGEYLTVVDASDPDSTLLFETDEQGVVIAVRNGFLDPIRWIEGCA